MSIKQNTLAYWQTILFHREVIQRFFKNSFWLTASLGMNGIVNLCLMIYLARTFGPTNYGKFAYSLSFVTLFSTLFDFGLTTVMLRELVLDQSQIEYFKSIFILKFFLGLFVLGLIFILSFYVTSDPLTQNVIISLSFYQFFLQSLNLINSVFRAEQRIQFEAFFRGIQIVMMVSFVCLLMWWNKTILSASIGYSLAVLVALISAIFYTKMNHSLWDFKFKLEKTILLRYLKFGLYLALAQGVGEIMMNTDSFLLGYWGFIKGVGYYNAANKINAILLFPMNIIATALFPLLADSLKKSNEYFQDFWMVWAKYTLFFSIFAAFFVFMKSNFIIHLFYSNDYAPAVPVLKVLMGMAVILYINSLFYQVLLVLDCKQTLYHALLLGSILNVGMNFLLIPRFGIVGSAVASAFSQFICCIVYAIKLRSGTFINPLHKDFVCALLIAVLSGSSMSFFVSDSVPIYYSIFLAFIIYALVYRLLSWVLKSIFHLVFYLGVFRREA